MYACQSLIYLQSQQKLVALYLKTIKHYYQNLNYNPDRSFLIFILIIIIMTEVHKLNDTWVFWYAPRGRKAIADADHYDVNLKLLGECKTVEDFFSYYCFFKRPSDIEVDQKIMMFRKGHKPMWEEFLEGGTWIIHFKKREYDILNQKWEALLLACIGEQFEDTNVIGVVLSIRERRNLLEIWLRDRRESEKIRIGERLRVVLEMDPNNLTFFFKEHSKSLTEKSTMKGAESYTFVKTPLETPQNEPRNQGSELDQFKL